MTKYSAERAISPNGFIDSLKIVASEIESLDELPAIIRNLNEQAAFFQAEPSGVQHYEPKGGGGAGGSTVAHPPATPSAPSFPVSDVLTQKVVNVYPQSEKDNAPLVVLFADGSKATTFDKKAFALAGKTISYGLVSKPGLNGKVWTNIKWYKETGGSF